MNQSPSTTTATKQLKVALAGQANVGKSVVFNYLTKSHQHIGNWPGKTVAKAEGTLHYKGHNIDIIDLPGIYSLTTYSTEEVISREYIIHQKPDFIINIVDGTNLERNLLFTLQLLELGKPVVLAINFADLFAKKGVIIDYAKLEKLLNIPVVPIEAIYGKGITKLLDRGIELLAKQTKLSFQSKYGKEVEKEIENLNRKLNLIDTNYSTRWLAIKLLEKDPAITKMISNADLKTIELAQAAIANLEKIHGHDASVIIAAERCHIVFEILQQAVKFIKHTKLEFSEKLDRIACSKICGYPLLILVLALTFSIIFIFGNFLSTELDKLLPPAHHYFKTLFGTTIWASLGWAALESIFGLIAIALPYILPFYFILSFLENSGYLARVAFLTDNLMHKLGIHGKGCIPLLLGYGCNVPACLSCRIMETYREKFITACLATSIPCSAITIIILGLVGKFLGLGWVFALYAFNLLIVFTIGKLLTKTMRGEPTELIMEMPDYRMPHLKTIASHTWFKTKTFVYMATPLVIIAGVIIHGLYITGLLQDIVTFLNPITVYWLRLPPAIGILLIFGILRKELILIMLATLLESTNFAAFLSPIQMLTLAIVSMFYIPCIATIVAFKKEFGWPKAIAWTSFKIGSAIILAGVAARVLSFFPGISS